MRPTTTRHLTLLALLLAAVLAVAGCSEEADEALPEPTSPLEDDDEADVDAEDPAEESEEGRAEEGPFDPESHFVDGEGSPLNLFRPGAEVAEHISHPDYETVWELLSPMDTEEYADREWANREELWDATALVAWEDALERYGEDLIPELDFVFPGEEMPAFVVQPWSSAMSYPEWGHSIGVGIGVQPEDPDRDRPDLAWYFFQVDGEEQPTTTPTAEVVAGADPCLISGELGWPSSGDSPAETAIGECLTERVEDGTFERLDES